VYGLTNGVISLYLNDELQRTVKKKNYRKKYHMRFKKEGFLVVAMTPTVSSKSAWANVKIEAWHIEAGTDICMGQKECLSLLADGSKEAFALRNSVPLQLQCLEAETVEKRRLVAAKCDPWFKCLHKSGKLSGLRVFLRAAVGEASLLSVAGHSDAALVADPTRSRCIDPASDDPESWNCNCFTHLTKVCKDDPLGNEACFRMKFCASCAVCLRWKEKHCCVTAVEQHKSNCSASKLVEEKTVVPALLARRKSHEGMEELGGSVDEVGWGKCGA
jgi:hypothetical protein